MAPRRSAKARSQDSGRPTRAGGPDGLQAFECQFVFLPSILCLIVCSLVGLFTESVSCQLASRSRSVACEHAPPSISPRGSRVPPLGVSSALRRTRGYLFAFARFNSRARPHSPYLQATIFTPNTLHNAPLAAGCRLLVLVLNLFMFGPPGCCVSAWAGGMRVWYPASTRVSSRSTCSCCSPFIPARTNGAAGHTGPDPWTTAIQRSGDPAHLPLGSSPRERLATLKPSSHPVPPASRP